MDNNRENTKQPPQHQESQPGKEYKMQPKPKFLEAGYKGCGKLQDKVAIITGGDSGIGRAVAAAFAKEGADIVITYLNEEKDAHETKAIIEEIGRKCLCISGDIGEESLCQRVVDETINRFNKINILVNNAAEQHVKQCIEEITSEQLERTFRTNIFSYFYMCKAVSPHLQEGDVIINTTSVTAYKGNPVLLDYSSTKGAIVAFTRSLSQAFIGRGIRVNGVAPGPIWTPLIPATFPEDQVAEFGGQVPMNRAGQPSEVAPCYVFLASDDSSYMAGQILHPNGGVVING